MFQGAADASEGEEENRAMVVAPFVLSGYVRPASTQRCAGGLLAEVPARLHFVRRGPDSPHDPRGLSDTRRFSQKK
jgi:hypothetical protein